MTASRHVLVSSPSIPAEQAWAVPACWPSATLRMLPAHELTEQLHVRLGEVDRVLSTECQDYWKFRNVLLQVTPSCTSKPHLL